MVACLCAMVVGGCGGTSSSPSTDGSSISPDSGDRTPIGIVAIGHSGLTGESSDLDRPGEPAPENSWASGTNPEVNSIYLRLAAERPETKDHVSNRASGGATADQLEAQATEALSDVPHPALIIVQVIDNDIQCDGTDATHVSEFGASVSRALQFITGQSPESRILIVGQPGRPSVASIEAELKVRPELKQETAGTGMCDFFDPNGKINKTHIANLARILKRYEAEQARVCGLTPNCATDEGVSAKFVDDPNDWILGHRNIHGQSRLAELFWPTVSSIVSK